MKNNSLIYSLGGVTVGIVLTTLFTSNAVNTNNTNVMNMMGIRYNQSGNQPTKPLGMGMGASMNDMMDSMGDKTADDFDKAFLKAMIVHHQGAIEMAEEAKVKAKHEEIKSLAGDIIQAQTKEIEQMKSWQIQWAY